MVKALERFWKAKCQSREGASRMSGSLHLAQAQSNRGQRRAQVRIFETLERLVKRLVSAELVLSFVPGAEQFHVCGEHSARTKYQRTRDKVRLQNQLEATAGRSPYQNYPVWFRICAGCQCTSYASGAWRMEEVILRLWPPWPIIACAPPRPNCMTLWVPARRSTRSIAGWIKLTLDDFEFVEQQISQLDHEIAKSASGESGCSRETRGSPRASE